MKVELKTKEELKPWEQHSTVITIPHFDYNAPLLSSVIPTPDSSSPAPSRGRRVQQKKPCQFLKSGCLASLPFGSEPEIPQLAQILHHGMSCLKWLYFSWQY
ncbi:uncharacterized protein LOC113754335 isoform X1 [Coffea eugenioides]|uniref:uncharacterized protein LOC113754335 isoform X1 n=1 Tax=Coffea eugenioides TaxID=49369 RepID=UPI000F60BE37|nr:uncharacterized protein LOC113754335 isoform X1 [Coffea eugenioides]